jgi:hypothetical protein
VLLGAGRALLAVSNRLSVAADCRIELREGRAQRVEAWGAGKSVFLDGAADERHERDVFGVGKVDRRH